MPRVVWTRAAERDLEEFAYYITFQDRRPIIADRIVEEITAKCATYAANSFLSPLYPELARTVAALCTSVGLSLIAPLLT